MNRILLITLTFVIYHHVSAQNWGVEVFKYQLADQTSFVDVAIELNASEMSMSVKDSLWTASTDITVVIEQGDQIKAFRKIQLSGPKTADSTEAWTADHMHLERFLLNAGIYQVTVNVEGTDLLFKDNIQMSVCGKPDVSDLMLVEAYAKLSNGEESPFSRSGFDIIPLLDNTIAPNADQARFYVELYNIDQVVGLDSLFLLSFGFTNSNGNWSPSHTRYLRLKAEPVVPVFEVLPVDGTVPPADGGFLKIEIKTRDGIEITTMNYPVSRWSPVDENNYTDVALSQFATQWTNRDKLYRHIEDHLPLASPSEQNTILGILKATRDLKMLQGFLDQFWVRRNPENPTKSWRNYKNEVTVVDSIFGGCRSGHGADTDQGYVYLKYGRPNSIVKRHHDTDYYPYEIWHYHHTSGFSNRRFLFYAPHVVLECLEILHSDMPGEISNNDWIEILKSRENRIKVTDTQLNRLNPRNTFSREEPEELFYNP